MKFTSKFLIAMLFFTNSLLPMQTGRNAMNLLGSYISNKTAIGLSLGGLLLTAFIINKNNKANALLKAKEDEAQYVSQNIKVTKNTIFVFDINDVIIKADFNKIWDIIKNKVLANYKCKLCSAFVRPYLYYIVFNEVSKGGVPEQILSKIAAEYPQFKDITVHGLELANAQSEVPGMFELIESLKGKGHDLLLLSNVGQDKFYECDSSIEMLSKEFPIFKQFDLSCSQLTCKLDNYIKKPQPGFYNKFLDKFTKKYGQSRVQDIIFIDDRLKNIQAARQLGIPSVWFIDSNDLKAKLKI